MLNNTNLEKCKVIARNLLNMEITIVNNDLFPIISHPIINDVFIPDKKLGVINILENQNAYDNLIQTYTQLIDNATDYDNLIIFIRNSYKLFFIKMTKEYLSLKDFSENLIESWIVDENANENVNVSQKELVRYFKAASKDYLMSKEVIY